MLPLIAFAFVCIYGLLLLYYRRGWQSLPVFEPIPVPASTFISVIIPARNEEKNIAALLNALSRQTYTRFEVIVVDDFSTDGTPAVVQAQGGPNVRLVQPEGAGADSSKKKAIETGIAAATGELVVTTDADCLPPADWLLSIQSFYVQTGAAFIAAPVQYAYNKSLLHTFQALDFLILQGITAASVATGFHTMCNGANLAYPKKAFTEAGGYRGIDHVATGDDVLLMYKIWKRHPDKVFYLKSKSAVVVTEPMPTWRDFIMQRKRWASKTLVYDDYRMMAVLIFVYLLNCLFVVLLAVALFNARYGWYVAGFWILKTAVEWPFVAPVARFYGAGKLLRLFFWLQPLHMLYTVMVGFISQLGKYEWKGRKTK